MSPALQAARDSAAVFLLEGRTHIEITGADRATFLHNFCTNDIKSLKPGQGCEAFVCNAKGHVLGHVTAFIGDEAIWLETVPGASQKLLTHLARYIIREDVELHDHTSQLRELFVVGPRATDALPGIRDPESLRSIPAPGTWLQSGTLWDQLCELDWQPKLPSDWRCLGDSAFPRTALRFNQRRPAPCRGFRSRCRR